MSNVQIFTRIHRCEFPSHCNQNLLATRIWIQYISPSFPIAISTWQRGAFEISRVSRPVSHCVTAHTTAAASSEWLVSQRKSQRCVSGGRPSVALLQEAYLCPVNAHRCCCSGVGRMDACLPSASAAVGSAERMESENAAELRQRRRLDSIEDDAHLPWVRHHHYGLHYGSELVGGEWIRTRR